MIDSMYEMNIIYFSVLSKNSLHSQVFDLPVNSKEK